MICAPAEISENSPTVKNFVRLRTEIFFRQLERIDGGFAGVNLAARVVDHLDELVDWRDVDLLHFFFHHRRRDPRHSRNGAHPGGHADAHRCRHAQRRIADGRDSDVVHFLFHDGVQAEEREKEVRVDPFHSRAVGHDQAGVNAFQRSARNDDRDFIDFAVVHKHRAPFTRN